jgi:hypothetical protein
MVYILRPSVFVRREQTDSRECVAKTREKCEGKLAELIKTMKAEIAEMKKAANA